MSKKSKRKKAICEECGVRARENTLYCYNCGHRIAGATDDPVTEAPADTRPAEVKSEPENDLSGDDEKPLAAAEAEYEDPEPSKESVPEDIADNGPAAVDDEKKAALDDLAAKFKIEEAPSDDKLAQAAGERRKARAIRRKPKQYVWEPGDDSSNRIILLMAVLGFVLAGVAVLLTVYWK